MAITIDIPTDRLYFTANLPSVAISDDENAVVLVNLYDNDDNKDRLSVKLTPYPGTPAILSGLDKILETFFLSKPMNTRLQTFDLMINGGDEDFFVQTCYSRFRQLNAPCLDMFLTGAASAFIPAAGKFTLALPVSTPSITLDIWVAGFDEDGAPTSVMVTRQMTNGVAEIDVAPIAATFPKVTHFTVRARGYNAHKTFYLSHEPNIVEFYFRNQFNCSERLYIPGRVTCKVEPSAEEAICNGVQKQYNRKVTKTFEFASSALVQDEIRLLEDLITSPEAYVKGLRVYISKAELTHSTNPEDLGSVKFTLAFEHLVPNTFNAYFDDSMPEPGNVFTSQFTLPFA